MPFIDTSSAARLAGLHQHWPSVTQVLITICHAGPETGQLPGLTAWSHVWSHCCENFLYNFKAALKAARAADRARESAAPLALHGRPANAHRLARKPKNLASRRVASGSRMDHPSPPTPPQPTRNRGQLADRPYATQCPRIAASRPEPRVASSPGRRRRDGRTMSRMQSRRD
jgi:hypothetical protein